MPRRTNEFQQLVRLLQEQIGESAEVAESAMLKDELTGEEKEVDVVVRTEVQGLLITVGFECTDRIRRADRPWVEKNIAKHMHLPVNVTVLVSRSGFSDRARELATKSGVPAISMEEAVEADWDTFIKGFEDLRLGAFSFAVVRGTVSYEGTPVEGKEGFTDETPLRFPDGTERTIGSYGKAVLADPKMARPVFKGWLNKPREERPQTFEFGVTARPQETFELLAAPGEWRRVQSVHLQVAATVDDTPLHLETAQLQGLQIAYGTAPNIFRDKERATDYLMVNLVQDHEGSTKAALFFPGSGAEEGEVHHTSWGTGQDGDKGPD